MIKYPYLPVGREIRLVPAEHPHMQAAKAVCRELSTDHSHPTGAVLVINGEVVVREANQAAIRHPYIRTKHANGWCVRRLLRIKSGQKYWLCPGCATHHQHAESRVARAAQARADIVDLDLSQAELYLWGHWWCCEFCWQAIIKAGIGQVYLMEGSEIIFNRAHPDNKIGRFE